jgi:hypothetical protein
MFINGSATNDGGGVYALVHNLTIDNTIFHNCWAGENGGGLWCSSDIVTPLRLIHLNFTNCTATNGSSLISRNHTLVFDQTNFNNMFPTLGAVILVESDGNPGLIFIHSVAFNIVPITGSGFIIGPVFYENTVASPGQVYWTPSEGSDIVIDTLCPGIPVTSGAIELRRMNDYQYNDSWGYDTSPITSGSVVTVAPPTSTPTPSETPGLVEPAPTPVPPLLTTTIIVVIVIAAVLLILAIVVVIILMRDRCCGAGNPPAGAKETYF